MNGAISEVQRVARILIGEDAVMRDLALVLVELRRIEGRVAVEDIVPAPWRGAALAGIVRDLEIADRGAAEHRQPAGVGQDLGKIAEPRYWRVWS